MPDDLMDTLALAEWDKPNHEEIINERFGSTLYPRLKRIRMPPADRFCAEKNTLKGVRTRKRETDTQSVVMRRPAVFHGLFNGRLKFCCKTVQSYVTHCEC